MAKMDDDDMNGDPGAVDKDRDSEESSADGDDDDDDNDNDASRADPSESLPAKPPPTMDVTVHRLRHLNFHPKPILCLASTTAVGVDGGGLLALSRDNGSVELKQATKLRTIATVAGFRQKPVNAMAWLPRDSSSTNDFPPLIGASRDGTLFCVDFARQSLTGITPSGGGGVFALTTKDRRRDPSTMDSSPLVAAGCEDGNVRIWKYERSSGVSSSDGTVLLSVVSTLPAAGGPILAIAWCTDQQSGGGKLFASVADGTIRVFDESLDAPLRWSATFRMTVESLGRTIPTRVWALEALRDGTLVSADSLGHVQFWDGTTGTLQQSIDQTDSKADVLCLAVSDDETTIFASGVDSRVVCIERVTATRAENSFGPILQWNLSHAQRPHTHDVNALTILRQSLRGIAANADTRSGEFQEILCSGGVDTKLCTHHVRDGRKKRPKTLYPWPATNLISIARKLRIFIIRREGSIDLYQLGPKQSFDENFPVQIPPDKTLIGTVQVESVSNLVCAAISDDGRFLAVSDASSVSVFLLTFTKNGHSVATMLQPQRITIDESPAFAASALCFHGSGNALACACFDGKLRYLEVERTEEEPVARVTQVLEFEAVDGGARRTAAQSVFATRDGNFLAITYNVPGCAIEIYRSTADAGFSHWWTVPTSDMNPSASTFLLTDEPLLAVACLNFSVYVFDVQGRKLSPWSEAAGFPVRNLPSEFLHRNDFPAYIALNPATRHKFLVASFGAFVVFDIQKKFPTRCRLFPEKHVRVKKNKRPRLSNAGPGNEGEECTLCLRYNSMLSLDAVSENELFVVEQPWLSVVATFPEALQRKVYGT